AAYVPHYRDGPGKPARRERRRVRTAGCRFAAGAAAPPHGRCGRGKGFPQDPHPGAVHRRSRHLGRRRFGVPRSVKSAPKQAASTGADGRPWYRQLWPWLILAVPAISILLSIVMLTLA